MKEDFVSYEIAVKLKEKGYPQNGNHYYNEKGNIDIPAYNLSDEDMSDTIAPQIYQVLKWLRKEKSLHIEIVSSDYGYIYIVSDTPDRGGTDRVNIQYKGKNDGGAWDDYNECVLDAIEYVIDNLI